MKTNPALPKTGKRTSRSLHAQVVRRLRKIIDDLRGLVIEHHSYSVMRDEHCVCPVCTKAKWDRLLNRATKAGARHNAAGELRLPDSDTRKETR